MDDFEKEIKIGFLEEAAQSVSDVEQCFLALESDPSNQENINKIFRLAHNLKGSSKAVGFDEFGAFTHQFESFILRVKNKELQPTEKVVNLLLRANDHVSLMIAGLREDLEARFDSIELLNEIKNYQESNGEVSVDASIAERSVEVESEPSIDFQMDPSMYDGMIPLAQEFSEENNSTLEVNIPTEVAAGPTLEESLDAIMDAAVFNLTAESANVELVPVPEVASQVAVQPLQNPEKSLSNSVGSTGASKSSVVEESIRVALPKVESLIDFVGELVILQSVIREQVIGKSEESSLLRKTISQMGKVGKEIQDIALGMRMIPVKSSFLKMQRIVRDVSRELNKEIEFTLKGEETELDKTVLERITDPMVHLVRNSVDHGIESAEMRLAAGKNPTGHVELRAYHSAGKLVIEVSDDGGGLDAEKLKRKAFEKGILKPGTVLTEKEAFNLVFAPGFSTKEKVTDISGRGVGMDVVNTNILEMGGEVQIESVLHKGTTFRMVLPLTLAIVDAMVITYSDEKFVLPMNHVHETLRPTTQMLQQTVGLGDVLMLRNENIPIFRLGDFFSIKNSNAMTDMIALVVKSGPLPFAIVVDDILGQYQVVIKRLGKELAGMKGVSGTTILGDGRPALIIEPQDLLKRKVVSCFVPKTNLKVVRGESA